MQKITLSFDLNIKFYRCFSVAVLGRLALTTIAVSILLKGPILNISNNVSELAAIPACTAELYYNQSLAIRQLARKPYLQLRDGIMTTTIIYSICVITYSKIEPEFYLTILKANISTCIFSKRLLEFSLHK